jgi:hypothetical protein
VFGVGWADQLTALKSSTADPASTFGKSTFSPTRLLLSALCAFARAVILGFLSRQGAKLAKAPLHPTIFFFTAPILISPSLANFAGE